MSSFSTLLRESITFACGHEGFEQFCAAGYGESTFADSDGAPDLHGLTSALLSVFPPEKASVIAGDFGRRLRSMTGVDGESGEDVFVKYFNTPSGEVKGLIIEARRVREAMGKELVDYGHEGLKVDTVDPIEREIAGFVYGRNTFTSLDILDFTRYLKSKEYSFQECIVLEKVYEKIEQRKKEEKIVLEQRIAGLISQNPAPKAHEISSFIERLNDLIVADDRHEVQRMIRDAMLRHG
ncbi:hypothetical protein [Methanocella sp. MCL-LM]|uniref:hypothetical protein n=1 Tax=Methanocella sp. MCL-LM TaxID=3412035 RepID=UPI003C77F5EB